MIGVVGVAMVVALGAARLGGAVVASARADTAADAAARAAASRLVRSADPARAEREAARTASANGARLVDCRCEGPVVAVEVELEWAGRVAHARARAEVRSRCRGLPGCDPQ
jgi:hypothetical protein